jgi:hypothetical protein
VGSGGGTRFDLLLRLEGFELGALSFTDVWAQV